MIDIDRISIGDKISFDQGRQWFVITDTGITNSRKYFTIHSDGFDYHYYGDQLWWNSPSTLLYKTIKIKNGFAKFIHEKGL